MVENYKNYVVKQHKLFCKTTNDFVNLQNLCCKTTQKIYVVNM
jgi:hypothetical protein